MERRKDTRTRGGEDSKARWSGAEREVVPRDLKTPLFAQTIYIYLHISQGRHLVPFTEEDGGLCWDVSPHLYRECVPRTLYRATHTHTQHKVFPSLQPEWYLTQVLLWMSNNSTFMEEKIQPILEGAETHLSARVGPG